MIVLAQQKSSASSFEKSEKSKFIDFSIINRMLNQQINKSDRIVLVVEYFR